MSRRSPTERFSDRVADYARYRPSYPPGVIDVLRAECGLSPGDTVADVGSGTGLLSELLLRYGNAVIGVEPNREMRRAGDRLLAEHERFRSVPGRAEATGLDDGSVDLIAVGHAFHWFDVAQARAEFLRILRPGGWVVLLWNDRDDTASPFMTAYESLIRAHGTDYHSINHRRITAETLTEFFQPHGYSLRELPNGQVFDYRGLEGRLLSSSYAPGPDQPGHAPMLSELRSLFDEHQSGGEVTLVYATKVYFGRPG